MATYMVTGGCGFIGSQLTKKLITQGHKVIVVDDLSNGNIIHPQSTLMTKDITQYDEIHDLFTEINGCFHLAAKPIVGIELDKWLAFHSTNLGGSLNVFKAAIDAGNIPVVYASSCGVYGDSKQFPLTEDQFIKPLCSYGCDKLSTELNASFLAHDYQLPSIGLRFFNVYGPFQQVTSPYSGVITRFITNLLTNKPLTIFGDGEQTRDFIFVEDIVDNLIHAMTILKREAHVVNLCTGVSISINQLADVLSNLLGKKYVKVHMPARLFDVQDSCGSPKKMHAYGFKVTHDRQQALSKTIEYFVRTMHQ